jgi:putative inorganic carbon (HCO3(-)) transporter
VTDRRLRQVEAGCLLLATPFLLFPSALSVPALLILLVPWALRWRLRGSPTLRTPMDVPILCLLVTVSVAVCCSPLPQESLRKLLGIVLGVAFFYGAVNSARTRDWFWNWMLVFVAAGVGIALLSLFGTDWASYKTLPLQPIYQRLPRLLHNVTTYGQGGFHPNEVGGALTLILPPTLAVCLSLLQNNPGWPATASAISAPHLESGRGLRWSRRILLSLLSASFIFTAVTFLLTQSRSAYLGLTVGLAAFGTLRSRWFLVALLALAVLALAVGMHLGLEDSVEALVQTQSARLGVGRFEIWRRAVWLIEDFPYTGIGLNTFPIVSEKLYPYPYRTAGSIVPHAHNNLLQVGVDLGVPGLVAYIGMLTSFALCAWRINRLSRSPTPRLLAAGIFAGVLAHQIYGLTDAITLGAKPGFLFWVLLGLMAALYRLEVPGERADADPWPGRQINGIVPTSKEGEAQDVRARLKEGKVNGLE